MKGATNLTRKWSWNMVKALVRSIILVALALKTFWAPLNFVVIFRFLKALYLIWQNNYFESRQVFVGNISLIFENDARHRKMSLDSCAQESKLI